MKKHPETGTGRTLKRAAAALREGGGIPDGLFRKCEVCGEISDTEAVIAAYHTCPACGHYFRIPPAGRLSMLLEPGSFEEWDMMMPASDPLSFPGYQEKISSYRGATGLDEAVVTGCGVIQGCRTAIGIMSGDFLMGSMGAVVGEKVTRLTERATQEGLPVILFCCSGGARMQEGMISLMQMAKTAQALKRHEQAGLLFVSVLTDPTMGGVTASFAMLGNVILAEPGALIGFAGPRVIEQTIGQKLPEGFQRAEFLQEHGMVDKIVPRNRLRQTLGFLLKSWERTERNGHETAGGLHALEEATSEDSPLSAWDRVRISRSQARPTALQYVGAVFERFLELHGDRAYGDDGAIIGGIAEIAGRYVTVIGQQKGRSAAENRRRNYGMPQPEGYRKALRLMKQAEQAGRPIICLVDTPGAFCGPEAEERGQGEAIASCLAEMSDLGVPVCTFLIGEGGSGGALALSLANEVYMLENAVYSILSPEGFASILWKDAKRAREAAGLMKITAAEQKKLGIIDGIIPEPKDNGVTVETLKETADTIRTTIVDFLERYEEMDGAAVRNQRYERFRKF
ncbi:MAG: acetyl-CoA carboxylase carboxyltransferase subunit beta [Lachnospiraceae bacterium]|nr:acetyl-CoA carboxylase carboxyltransferase subunit beta [Lachnospiraceae bacterium]